VQDIRSARLACNRSEVLNARRAWRPVSRCARWRVITHSSSIAAILAIEPLPLPRASPCSWCTPACPHAGRQPVAERPGSTEASAAQLGLGVLRDADPAAVADHPAPATSSRRDRALSRVRRRERRSDAAHSAADARGSRCSVTTWRSRPPSSTPRRVPPRRGRVGAGLTGGAGFARSALDPTGPLRTRSPITRARPTRPRPPRPSPSPPALRPEAPSPTTDRHTELMSETPVEGRNAIGSAFSRRLATKARLEAAGCEGVAEACRWRLV